MPNDYGSAAAAKPFTFPADFSTAPTYENIMKTLTTPMPSQADYMPEIAELLSQRSQFVQPAIEGMRAQGNIGAANLMGAMGKRGLTGGSIEASALAQHEGDVGSQINQVLANLAMSNSQVFIQLLSQARTGDVQAQRQLMQMIAQAMGEEMTAQRDMSMWQQELAAGIEGAARQRRQGMWSSGLGAVGTIGGAIAGGMLAGPGGGAAGAAAGATIGGAAGSAGGSYFGGR